MPLKTTHLTSPSSSVRPPYRMLSWQIRTAALLAVGRQVWQRLGCLASACPRRSTIPVAVRNQKSQTGPHGWASSLSASLIFSMLPDRGRPHPSSGPQQQMKSSRPVTRVSLGPNSRCPIPSLERQLLFDPARDEWVRVQKSGGSRLAVLVLDDGSGPISRLHLQLAERFMGTSCR